MLLKSAVIRHSASSLKRAVLFSEKNNAKNATEQ